MTPILKSPDCQAPSLTRIEIVAFTSQGCLPLGVPLELSELASLSRAQLFQRRFGVVEDLNTSPLPFGAACLPLELSELASLSRAQLLAPIGSLCGRCEFLVFASWCCLTLGAPLELGEL